MPTLTVFQLAQMGYLEKEENMTVIVADSSSGILGRQL